MKTITGFNKAITGKTTIPSTLLHNGTKVELKLELDLQVGNDGKSIVLFVYPILKRGNYPNVLHITIDLEKWTGDLTYAQVNVVRSGEGRVAWDKYPIAISWKEDMKNPAAFHHWVGVEVANAVKGVIFQ